MAWSLKPSARRRVKSASPTAVGLEASLSTVSASATLAWREVDMVVAEADALGARTVAGRGGEGLRVIEHAVAAMIARGGDDGDQLAFRGCQVAALRVEQMLAEGHQPISRVGVDRQGCEPVGNEAVMAAELGVDRSHMRGKTGFLRHAEA